MTDKLWLVVLMWAFAGVATLSMAAYIPQVVASFRSPSARRGTVLLTWWVWALGAVIETLYMAFVAKDLLLVVVALVHVVACTLVATAGTVERLRWAPIESDDSDKEDKGSPAELLSGRTSRNAIV